MSLSINSSPVKDSLGWGNMLHDARLAAKLEHITQNLLFLSIYIYVLRTKNFSTYWFYLRFIKTCFKVTVAAQQIPVDNVISLFGPSNIYIFYWIPTIHDMTSGIICDKTKLSYGESMICVLFPNLLDPSRRIMPTNSMHYMGSGIRV